MSKKVVSLDRGESNETYEELKQEVMMLLEQRIQVEKYDTALRKCRDLVDGAQLVNGDIGKSVPLLQRVCSRINHEI